MNDPITMNDNRMPKRVLLVDDHPIVRVGLRQVIAGDARFIVVAEAGDGVEALRFARELSPQVIVMDIDLPGDDGLTVFGRLQAEGLQMPVVVLTIHKREALFNDAVRLGVSGFVLKENAVTELLDALATVVKGDLWFSPAFSGYWARRTGRQNQLRRENPGLDLLTPTERKVMQLISERLTTREIGVRLGSSPLTVETHRKNICRKLELEGSHPLLEFALRHRLDF